MVGLIKMVNILKINIDVLTSEIYRNSWFSKAFNSQYKC